MRSLSVLMLVAIAAAPLAPCAMAAPGPVAMAKAGGSRPASARLPEAYSADEVLKWISAYHHHPVPGDMPNAVAALSRFGAFKDPETAGVYVGFMAGVIGAHPERAGELIARMVAIPPEDHWAIVRAVAYSGLPQWKQLLMSFASRMPSRRLMIQNYLNGQLPTLDQVDLKDDPGFWQRAGSYLSVSHYFGAKPDHKPVLLEPSPEFLDALWGYYFATGSETVLARIVAMLPWSTDKDKLDRLTLGAMAKYTLARNAMRDSELLAGLEAMEARAAKDTKPILKEVIEAAETADTARIHHQALAMIQELQQKGPGSKRTEAWWGKVAEGGISAGCLAAAALGQAELGVPCVVGGGLSSAALQFWTAQ